MNNPEVVKGQDATIPHLWSGANTLNDPSGLESNGFDDADVRPLLQIANDTLSDLCREAPSVLIPKIPRTSRAGLIPAGVASWSE